LIFACENSLVLNISSLDKENIQFDFEGSGNSPGRRQESANICNILPNFPLYQTSFNQVMAEIQNGNTFLINLTASVPISADATLKEIFNTAKARYRINFKDEWCCFLARNFRKSRRTIRFQLSR
jgi:para-aminobenzoate synthetase component 1